MESTIQVIDPFTTEVVDVTLLTNRAVFHSVVETSVDFDDILTNPAWQQYRVDHDLTLPEIVAVWVQLLSLN